MHEVSIEVVYFQIWQGFLAGRLYVFRIVIRAPKLQTLSCLQLLWVKFSWSSTLSNVDHVLADEIIHMHSPKTFPNPHTQLFLNFIQNSPFPQWRGHLSWPCSRWLHSILLRPPSRSSKSWHSQCDGSQSQSNICQKSILRDRHNDQFNLISVYLPWPYC